MGHSDLDLKVVENLNENSQVICFYVKVSFNDSYSSKFNSELDSDWN